MKITKKNTNQSRINVTRMICDNKLKIRSLNSIC